MSAPTISLVIVDTDCHVLANEAVQTSMKRFKFNDVLIFSDRTDVWNNLKVKQIDQIKDIDFYNRFCIHELHKHVKTTHALVIQFDGFILNPQEWSPMFLHYDYIGAPWPKENHGEYNVGNGGFSLRSKKLMDAVTEYPYDYFGNVPEDIHIAQRLRPKLEKLHDVHFPDQSIASHFSAESYIYRYPTFGFHNIRFLPLVYRDRLDFMIDNLSDRVVKTHTHLILPNLMSVSQTHGHKLMERMGKLK